MTAFCPVALAPLIRNIYAGLDPFFFFDTLPESSCSVSMRRMPIAVYFIKIGRSCAEATQDGFLKNRLGGFGV